MSKITLAPPRPNFAELERELGRLAYAWRSNPHDALVAQYQNTLRRMMRNGFDQPLDIDAELPDRLMPEEYLKLHR